MLVYDLVVIIVLDRMQEKKLKRPRTNAHWIGYR